MPMTGQSCSGTLQSFGFNRRAFHFFVSFPSCVLMDFTPAMHRVGRGDNLWSMQWLMKSFWQEFGKIFAKVHAAIHKLLMVKFKRFHTQGFECGSCVVPRSLTVCSSRVGKPPPWCAHHHGAPHNFFILQPQSVKIGLDSRGHLVPVFLASLVALESRPHCDYILKSFLRS